MATSLLFGTFVSVQLLEKTGFQSIAIGKASKIRLPGLGQLLIDQKSGGSVEVYRRLEVANHTATY